MVQGGIHCPCDNFHAWTWVTFHSHKEKGAVVKLLWMIKSSFPDCVHWKTCNMSPTMSYDTTRNAFLADFFPFFSLFVVKNKRYTVFVVQNDCFKIMIHWLVMGRLAPLPLKQCTCLAFCRTIRHFVARRSRQTDNQSYIGVTFSLLEGNKS